MSESTESQSLSVLRIWAALAWADDVMEESEKHAMTSLIAVAGLSDEERAIARGFLETKVDLTLLSVSGLSVAAQEGIYRAAVRLAQVDHDVAAEETAMLQRLRDGFGMSIDRAREIENNI